jgi:hypothetical protein
MAAWARYTGGLMVVSLLIEYEDYSMSLKRVILLLLTIIFGWQCHGFAQRPPLQANIPKDTIIKLQRLADAFGNGPEYRLKITADGAVTFERFMDFKLQRPIKGRISREKVAQLVAEFEKIDFFSLKDGYGRHEDGCPNVGTDQAAAIVYLQMNGRKKSVFHYHVCMGSGGMGDVYPPQLFALEKRIDEVVNTKQWIE